MDGSDALPTVFRAITLIWHCDTEAVCRRFDADWTILRVDAKSVVGRKERMREIIRFDLGESCGGSDFTHEWRTLPRLPPWTRPVV